MTLVGSPRRKSAAPPAGNAVGCQRAIRHIGRASVLEARSSSRTPDLLVRSSDGLENGGISGDYNWLNRLKGLARWLLPIDFNTRLSLTKRDWEKARATFFQSLPSGHVMSILLVYPVGDTLTQCDPFGIPSTSLWTGAAIIVQSLRTKSCIVTRPRTSPRPMLCSLAG
jgi:hypothetical protein